MSNRNFFLFAFIACVALFLAFGCHSHTQPNEVSGRVPATFKGIIEQNGHLFLWGAIALAAGFALTTLLPKLTWGSALMVFGGGLLAISFVAAALVPWMKWMALIGVLGACAWIAIQWKKTGSLKAAVVKIESTVKQSMPKDGEVSGGA